MLALRWLALVSIWFSALSPAPPSAVAQPVAPQQSAAGAISPAAYLQADGSLAVPANFSGSFDVEGWDVRLDPAKGPVFSPLQDPDTETPTESLTPSETPTASDTPEDTLTPSETLTPSDTPTASDTPTETETPSETLTPSETQTPSETPTASETPTSTLTSSQTPTSSLTPTPCSGTPNPATNGYWSPVGGSSSYLGDRVFDIQVACGVIYAGGEFINAGGSGDQYADGIAQFVGGSWVAVGGSSSHMSFGTINAIEIVGGIIYAGGSPVNVGGDLDADKIYKFTNGFWSSLGGAGTGLSSTVRDILIDDGVLYAAGFFIDAGGDPDADYIAKFSEGRWSSLGGPGTGLNNFVFSIDMDGGSLYAGGDFTNAGGDEDADKVAKFSNGTWSSINGANSGLAGRVYHVKVESNVIYAGGDFLDAGNDPNGDHIARFEGGSWSALGTGLNDTVYDIEFYSGDIYAGGLFENAGGDADADKIAKFSGGSWSRIGWALSNLNSTVYTLHISNGVLYAGGAFTNAGGFSGATHIAQFGLAPIPSPTPSNTPTPSSTRTPSRTPTSTPSKTYTPSMTYTPSLTYTPSITPTPTLPASGNPSSPFSLTLVKNPPFIWTQVTGATQYRFEVSQGTTVVYLRTALPGICDSLVCTDTSITNLANGEYKWRVQAMLSGVWSPYSSYKEFTLTSPSFNSDFSGNANGWSPIRGGWTVLDGTYQSEGLLNNDSGVVYTDNYSLLTYEVNMARWTNNDYDDNYIVFRGQANANSTYGWSNGYYFGYIPQGLFLIGFFSSGSFYTLVPWTHSSAIEENYNTLRVEAGGSLLQFFINDTLVAFGSDDTYSSGKVGVGFYIGNSQDGELLEIYNASLTTFARGLHGGELNNAEVVYFNGLSAANQTGISDESWRFGQQPAQAQQPTSTSTSVPATVAPSRTPTLTPSSAATLTPTATPTALAPEPTSQELALLDTASPTPDAALQDGALQIDASQKWRQKNWNR